MKACSFTGHRTIKASHKDALPDLITRAIEYAYGKGCRKFFAGGALGFDTEAAIAVINYRKTHPDVTLTLLLPCFNQGEKWSEYQRNKYDYILNLADEVVYVSREYTPDCMRIRNQRLAEECDILIAYVQRSASGAGQTVRIASALGKEVYNLYPHLG